MRACRSDREDSHPDFTETVTQQKVSQVGKLFVKFTQSVGVKIKYILKKV